MLEDLENELKEYTDDTLHNFFRTNDCHKELWIIDRLHSLVPYLQKN